MRTNAIDRGTKGPIRTRTMWHAKGHIRVRRCVRYVERRISAETKDAAIAEAHAVGMSVRDIAQVES